jgi:hypothetical protein
MDGVASDDLRFSNLFLINGVTRYVAVLAAMVVSFADLVSSLFCTAL